GWAGSRRRKPRRRTVSDETRAPHPLVCPRAPHGDARGDGAVPPSGRGPRLRLRRVDRPPPADAARLRVHLARADHAPLGPSGCHADAPARNDGARPAAPQPGLLRQGVGDARSPLRRAVDPRHRRRLARGGVPPHGRAPPRARRADERGDRARPGALGGRPRDLRGRVLPRPGPHDRSEARAAAAPADLDRRRLAAVREGLRPDRDEHRPRAPAHREVRRHVGAAFLGDARDGEGRLGGVQRFARELGRDPAKIGRVYSNFIWVLRPGERPESAIPHFSVYSGMDLEYWSTHYLLGEAKELAERISARIEALDGGVDTIVLNPLTWGMDQLELIAGEVLPRVQGGR